MTGDTLTDEKTPQSPTSPTDTDATLSGDAIIEIGEEHDADSRPQTSSVSGETAQPQDEKKPNVLRRVAGSFKYDPEPEDVLETKTRTLEGTPNGFPRLAAFHSSEANFSLYRSFSYLHSRVLLDLQDEITSLERELDEIDLDDAEEDPDRLRSREIDVDRAADEGTSRNRRVILREIKEKLIEYDDVLIRARKLESFTKPSDRNYTSVRRYHHNTQPLMDAEMDSIRSKEDVISLSSGREWATFDGVVEKLVRQTDRFLRAMFNCDKPPLEKYFRTPELQAKTNSEFISLYSMERINKLVNILITFVIFVLLVIPVVTLYHLTSTSAISNLSDLVEANATVPASAVDDYNRDTFNAVGVLIVFTLLFSAAMSLLTKAARHELFAASAAYCAILVVFIGNFTGPGN
ncbi:hypothetical protein BKA63DRAFT_529459 [Paraphoma chrysanthemicola]|nr:hypothetical protein BKA63DRAFT_529459 [Paraphoma chrysanthemicola]